MNQAASLLELQRLDLEILRAKKRLEELPEKQAILDVRHKLRDVSALRHKAELLVGKLERRPEGPSGRDRDPHRQDRRRAGQGHDDRPTTARSPSLTREMDGLRRRRDKLEMESLRADGPHREGDRTDGDDRRGTRAAHARRRPPPSSSSSRSAARCRHEIAGFEAERSALAAALDAATLADYEAARESKGGVGVGRLDGDTCSACRMSLPAERISELLAGPDVAVCPHCHRLIVVRTGDE